MNKLWRDSWKKTPWRRRWDVFGRISTGRIEKRKQEIGEEEERREREREEVQLAEAAKEERRTGGTRRKGQSQGRQKISDMVRQDWDHLMMQNQTALAEQREYIRVVKGGWNVTGNLSRTGPSDEMEKDREECKGD